MKIRRPSRTSIALTFASALLSSACSGAGPRAPDSKAPPTLGVPCPMGPGEPPAEDRFESPKVFTEVALVEVPLGYVPRPPVGSSVADLTGDPKVVVTTVAHLLATQGAAATSVVAPPGQGTRITVVPTIDRGGTVSIDLEVIVESSPNPPAVKTTTMKTTLVMRDQQLVIAGGRQSEGKSLLVLVMPYVVRGNADLAQLYQCKRARAASPPA